MHWVNINAVGKQMHWVNIDALGKQIHWVNIDSLSKDVRRRDVMDVCRENIKQSHK